MSANDYVEKYKKEFLNWCDDFDKWAVDAVPQSSKAKEAGARPAFITIGLLTFLIIFSLYKNGQNATSNMIGFVFPTYFAIKALRTSGKDDDTQWLTYFVTYSFFTCIESVTDVFVSWIPLYYVVKTLFLIWLQHPSTRGAELMFNKAINPGMDKVAEVLAVLFNQERRDSLKGKMDGLKEKLAGSVNTNDVSKKDIDDAMRLAKKLE